MAKAAVQSFSENHADWFSKDEIGPLVNYLFLPLMMTLLFLQAIREFIGQIYFQNLGAMSLGLSVLLVFLLLSPIIVVLLRRLGAERLLLLSGIGVVLFRFLMPFIQSVSTFYMLAAGLVVASFGMYLPVALSIRFQGMPESLPSSSTLFSTGFALALTTDLMMRTIGVTWDPSTGPFGFLIAPFLCLLTLLLLYKAYSSRSMFSSDSPSPRSASRTKMAFYGLGFGGLTFAILTFLVYPNVLARWSAGSYELAVFSIAIGLIVYGLLSVHEIGEQLLMRRDLILVVNLVAIVTALDMAYLLSPLTGLLAGVCIFAFMLDLRLLWGHLQAKDASLTDYAIFHFTGMLILLFLTLFYVLTLVAGLILPALEGLSPYLILISFILGVIPSLLLGLQKEEVAV